ncbi:MAG: helix-turn-helix transcriptional regulator [Muribaculaceae bacterium]|nr:helix-turn-helix transcriptional regulator [Muribaculaceae bacterium]
MTLNQLAEKIGIQQPSMSGIVNGKIKPSLDTLEKIASTFGVSIGELFDEKDSNTFSCPHCGRKMKVVPIEKGKEK